MRSVMKANEQETMKENRGGVGVCSEHTRKMLPEARDRSAGGARMRKDREAGDRLVREKEEARVSAARLCEPGQGV